VMTALGQRSTSPQNSLSHPATAPEGEERHLEHDHAP
jgi:hypothetical protein